MTRPSPPLSPSQLGERDIPLALQPDFVLSVEMEELFIQAQSHMHACMHIPHTLHASAEPRTLQTHCRRTADAVYHPRPLLQPLPDVVAT